jgi:glutamate formiminotransferase
LVAYNINLKTPDVEIARRIAKSIRESSGGLPNVKALGLPLESRGLAQVSMNLTDIDTTPVHAVYEAVRNEANRLGVEIESSEIIGLIPRRALERAAEHFLKIENYAPEVVLEQRIFP